MEEARLTLKIEGRVQGVFFRASAAAEAGRLGLRGWVRNSSDGSVEAVAEGKKESLETLLAWCRHGPPGARVERVHALWQDYRGEFPDFRVTK